MKKTFIILVLILSFGFVIDVDAKEAFYVKQNIIEGFSFSDFFELNDKYYFFNKQDTKTFYGFYTLTNDFTVDESLYLGGFTNFINLDNYLYVSDDGKLMKINSENEIVASYNFPNSNTRTSYISAVNNDNLLVYYCYSYSYICSFNYFNKDLEFIKTVDANNFEFDFIDFFGSYNNKSVVINDANLYFLDKDLNLKKSFVIEKEYNNGRVLSEAKIFGDDGLFLIYIDDEYYALNHSNKVFVYNYDLDGNLKWHKEYETSLRTFFGNSASISKTDDNNFIISNGSFVEIDKKGNVITSCPRCSLFTGTLKIDDSYYGVGIDFGDVIKNDYLTIEHTVISQLKFIDEGKLTIKDSENGRVRVNRNNPHVGEEIIITLRPQNGYECDEIKLLDKDGKKIEYKKLTDKKYLFILPSGESTLKVSFKKIDKKN